MLNCSSEPMRNASSPQPESLLLFILQRSDLEDRAKIMDCSLTSSTSRSWYESEDYIVILALGNDLTRILESHMDNKMAWRLYTPLYAASNSNEESLRAVTHTLVLNGMSPKPEDEDDFNQWYAEEHVPLLSSVPGWIYSRRYRLIQSSSFEAKVPPNYLAVHAWESEESFLSDEYKQAVSTPWRNRVVNSVTAKERYVLTSNNTADS
ncbi:hypothetical protein D9613_000960 [Agrocybe pediades]|uniref:Uncharacterized protein n=1 Tax=Agrocybe pediades TaxID=84607 RepID=A0A8H4QZI3_9AGAR|nr:hypothetical protein D9613_000960 [Agrocybe pediades]